MNPVRPGREQPQQWTRAPGCGWYPPPPYSISGNRITPVVMFPWEGKELAEIDALMAARDPRRFRLGLVTDTAVDTATVMVWFSGRSEMGHYLARVEPRRRGLDGLDYIRLRDVLQDTLAGLEIRGTSAELRDAVNACADPVFQIRWWGTLEALRLGDDPWTRARLAELEPAATRPLPARRTSELLERLQRYAPRDPA